MSNVNAKMAKTAILNGENHAPGSSKVNHGQSLMSKMSNANSNSLQRQQPRLPPHRYQTLDHLASTHFVLKQIMIAKEMIFKEAFLLKVMTIVRAKTFAGKLKTA